MLPISAPVRHGQGDACSPGTDKLVDLSLAVLLSSMCFSESCRPRHGSSATALLKATPLRQFEATEIECICTRVFKLYLLCSR